MMSDCVYAEENRQSEQSVDVPGCAIHLTPTQKRIILFIVEHASQTGEVACSKGELATAIRCSTKTVDQAIRGLRKDGVIETVSRYLEHGGQTSNAYRIADRFLRKQDEQLK